HKSTARKKDETCEQRMRKALFAVEAELEKRRERRATREPAIGTVPPLHGAISKLFRDEGYGFILQNGGGEVYFHRNALHGLKYEDLEDGTEVIFNVEDGKKGPQA